MKNNKLRMAVKKAEEKLNEANRAVQLIETYLIFHKFNRDTPRVSVCGEGEIILEYYGREMFIDEAIERMEEYGYITPNDF